MPVALPRPRPVDYLLAMATSLEGRRILVAVSGGIAAYKTAFAVRALVAAGANVRVTMTRAATQFVAARSFEAVSGHPVLVDLFGGGGEVDHVALARFAEVALVAPATANLIARMAHGFADDAPTTVLLATEAPVIVAPAMNDAMWRNAATQANVETLRARGVTILPPAEGFLAEGYEGVGRMVEPDALVDAVAASLRSLSP